MSLYGLVHKVAIVRRAQTSNSMGNVVETSVGQTTVYANRRCRISRLDQDEDALRSYGLDSGDYWKVVAEYSPLLANADMAVVPSGMPSPAGNYRVVWHQQYSNETGRPHHTTVIMELE